MGKVAGNMDLPKTKVVIPHLVHQKIMHWVQKASPQECSGFGVTKVIGGNIYVTDVIMAKQSNGGATTDIEADAVAKAMYRMKDVDGELNFWWHSHANMEVFWSSTDKDTIAMFANGGMCVASVFNVGGKVKTAIALTSPFNLFIDDVDTKVRYEIDREITEEWDKEYEDNVEKEKPWMSRAIGICDSGSVSEEAWRSRSRFGYDGWGEDEWWRDHRRNPHYRSSPQGNGASVGAVTPGTADAKTKWDYAMNRDEIQDYSSIYDEFTLIDGSKVDAEQYMKLNPTQEEIKDAVNRQAL